MLKRLSGWFNRRRSSSSRQGMRYVLTFVDAENCGADPDEFVRCTNEKYGPLSELRAYSKWTSNPDRKGGMVTWRQSGFRCFTCDSGSNNADIMLSLDAYQRVSDLERLGATRGIFVLGCDGDKGYTHLLEKIRRLGWTTVLLSCTRPPAALAALADEVHVLEERLAGGQLPLPLPAAPVEPALPMAATPGVKKIRRWLRKEAVTLVQGRMPFPTLVANLGRRLREDARLPFEELKDLLAAALPNHPKSKKAPVLSRLKSLLGSDLCFTREGDSHFIEPRAPAGAAGSPEGRGSAA